MSHVIGRGRYARETYPTTPRTAPAPGTPAYNPTWYARTDVYWDPAGTNGGSNGNSGGVGSPILTFAEIVQRYGSAEPELPYGQSLTLHKLSTQPAGQDPVFFAPKISGGGDLVLLDTLVVVAGPFVAGTVTPQVVGGGGGTRLQVAGMPAGCAARQVVFNVDRNSWATIDFMTGASATMTQPLSGITTPGQAPLGTGGTPDSGWVTGNHLIVYQTSALNLKYWQAVGVDQSAANGGISWVQNSRIIDYSGTGASWFTTEGRFTSAAFSCCTFDPNVTALDSAYFFNCDLGQELYAAGSQPIVSGGVVRASIFVEYGIPGFINNVVLHGQFRAYASMPILQDVYCDSAGFTGEESATIRMAGPVWGTAAVVLSANACFRNVSGLTWVNSLFLSALNLTTGEGGLITTGTTYAAGVWTDGVALTAANLDLYTTIMSTDMNGGRYTE